MEEEFSSFSSFAGEMPPAAPHRNPPSNSSSSSSTPSSITRKEQLALWKTERAKQQESRRKSTSRRSSIGLPTNPSRPFQPSSATVSNEKSSQRTSSVGGVKKRPTSAVPGFTRSATDEGRRIATRKSSAVSETMEGRKQTNATSSLRHEGAPRKGSRESSSSATPNVRRTPPRKKEGDPRGKPPLAQGKGGGSGAVSRLSTTIHPAERSAGPKSVVERSHERGNTSKGGRGGQATREEGKNIQTSIPNVVYDSDALLLSSTVPSTSSTVLPVLPPSQKNEVPLSTPFSEKSPPTTPSTSTTHPSTISSTSSSSSSTPSSTPLPSSTPPDSPTSPPSISSLSDSKTLFFGSFSHSPIPTTESVVTLQKKAESQDSYRISRNRLSDSKGFPTTQKREAEVQALPNSKLRYTRNQPEGGTEQSPASSISDSTPKTSSSSLGNNRHSSEFSSFSSFTSGGPTTPMTSKESGTTAPGPPRRSSVSRPSSSSSSTRFPTTPSVNGTPVSTQGRGKSHSNRLSSQATPKSTPKSKPKATPKATPNKITPKATPKATPKSVIRKPRATPSSSLRRSSQSVASARNERSELGAGTLSEMEGEYDWLKVMLTQWVYANAALEKSFETQEKAAIETLYEKWKMNSALSRLVALEEMHLERAEEEAFFLALVEMQQAAFQQLSPISKDLFVNYDSLGSGLESTTHQVPVSSDVTIDIPQFTENLKDTGKLTGKYVKEMCGDEEDKKEVEGVHNEMEKLSLVIQQHHKELDQTRELIEQTKCLSREEESLQIQLMALKDEIDQFSEPADSLFGLNFGPPSPVSESTTQM